MNILFLAAHTDDEITSAATLLKLKEQGHKILYVAFSYCNREELLNECKEAIKYFATVTHFYSLPNRTFDSSRQFILDALVEINIGFQPDIVFCPSSNAGHQDHEVLHNESRRAFKNCTIYGWEMVWNMTAQHLTVCSEITEDQLKAKINNLKLYQSQQYRPYFNNEFIRALAVVRGVQFKVQLAEAFEAIRIKI